MKTFLIGSSIVAALLATSASAAPVTGKTYVMKAGASDLFERQSAALMLKSANPDIRKFAAMMTTDHTKSTVMVKNAAVKAKMKVAPPTLEPTQATNLAALRAASGADRDALYISQQKMAHAEALELQQGYATGGDVPTLKAAAAKIVPVVEHHKMMLDAM